MKDSINPKHLFQNFLQEHFPDRAEILLEKFENYLEELFSINQQVNLVSRKMEKNDYWLYHFLDSLLIIKCMEIYGGEVLDFGSGGGLPGIPLKLAIPDLNMVLLESVGKKVRCLEDIIARLELKECKAVWSRLEDYAKAPYSRRFDLILCRSVKVEAEYIKPLSRLLKQDGKMVFYKARQLDDLAMLPDIKICDVSRDELGQRQIVTVTRQSLDNLVGKNKFG
jgi:16S rRNA (guanine527-N7)-methyltransferase